jgi:hypothetical protein
VKDRRIEPVGRIRDDLLVIAAIHHMCDKRKSRCGVVDMDIKQESITPLLARVAVKRTSSVDIPGYFSIDRNVWVVDQGEIQVPIISLGNTEHTPLTKLRGEEDDVFSGVALELITKTMQQMEHDDVSPRLSRGPEDRRSQGPAEIEQNPFPKSWMLELFTKTEVAPEQDE